MLSGGSPRRRENQIKTEQAEKVGARAQVTLAQGELGKTIERDVVVLDELTGYACVFQRRAGRRARQAGRTAVTDCIGPI